MKVPEPDTHGIISRHARIAFELSGGADSVAALYALRTFWDIMTVYHVDTGDQFPEIAAVIDAVSRDVPIIVIRQNVKDWRDDVGYPSDIVPFDNTNIGRSLSGRTIKIVSRMECCAANLMGPLHSLVLRDGNTLLVRGTLAEDFKGPGHLLSGWTDGEVELLNAIEDWSKEEVISYCLRNELPLAPFYEQGMRNAPECMGCTAYWDENRMQYLRRNYPEAADAYRDNLKTLRGEILAQMGHSLQELRNG
jgi:3'-phosphoadenosine 5'-phosphosulfate sulfotransferase (PAPS reductase)/FAD synthetase